MVIDRLAAAGLLRDEELEELRTALRRVEAACERLSHAEIIVLMTSYPGRPNRGTSVVQVRGKYRLRTKTP